MLIPSNIKQPVVENTSNTKSTMRSYINSPDYLDPFKGISQRQLDGVLGTSVAQREIEKAFSLAKEAEKWRDPFGLAKLGRDYAAELREQAAQNSFKDLASLSYSASGQRQMLESLGLAKSLGVDIAAQLALKEYADTMDIRSQVKKLGLGLQQERNLAELTGLAAAQTAAASALGSLNRQVEYERAAASASLAQQLSTAVVEQDLYRRFAETLDIRKSLPTELWSSAAEVAKHGYEHLFAVDDVWRKQLERLTKPDYLTSLLSVIQHDIEEQVEVAGFHPEDSTGGGNDEELLRELSNAESPERFAEILSRCPKWLKWAILTFVVSVVLPIMQSIAGNLITPYVDEYIHGKPAVQQCVQVREIKKLSMGELGVELRDYRFSTVKTLALRETPSARARQTGELSFGQVVTVVSVQRDWTEVMYEYGDGQMVSGWVFTRYLAKFRK